MKLIYTIILLLAFSFSANSQTWSKKSYTSLKLSYPDASMQKEYVAVPGLLSTYGFYYPHPKKLKFDVHVMETPSEEWGVTEAHELTVEAFESLFIYDDTELEELSNKKIAGLKAKYAKTSGPYGDTQMAYIFFYKGNAILVIGNYPTKKEKEVLPMLRKFFKEIELI